MNKYEMLSALGDGTYGTVFKARSHKTGETVAVKKMKKKFFSWDECVNLAEVSSLRKLHTHPNIIKLKEVVRENNELFFVFEFMDGDLLGMLRQYKPRGLPVSRVKSVAFQLLQALAHLHKVGYFHRDLKPENILTRKQQVAVPSSSSSSPPPPSTATLDIVKLADFGLVKETRARPPFTEYVSTRWYRAPEILLQDPTYNSPVDMWAVGCILCELYTGRPLFAGNNEIDQMFKIVSTLGTPTELTWPDGMQLAKRLRYNFPNGSNPIGLKSVLDGTAPPLAFDLITKLLVFNPVARLTAAQALLQPFFRVHGDDAEMGMMASATLSSTQASSSRGASTTTTTSTVSPAPSTIAATGAPNIAGAPAPSLRTVDARTAQAAGSSAYVRAAPLVAAQVLSPLKSVSVNQQPPPPLVGSVGGLSSGTFSQQPMNSGGRPPIAGTALVKAAAGSSMRDSLDALFDSPLSTTTSGAAKKPSPSAPIAANSSNAFSSSQPGSSAMPQGTTGRPSIFPLPFAGVPSPLNAAVIRDSPQQQQQQQPPSAGQLQHRSSNVDAILGASRYRPTPSEATPTKFVSPTFASKRPPLLHDWLPQLPNPSAASSSQQQPSHPPNFGTTSSSSSTAAMPVGGAPSYHQYAGGNAVPPVASGAAGGSLPFYVNGSVVPSATAMRAPPQPGTYVLNYAPPPAAIALPGAAVHSGPPSTSVGASRSPPQPQPAGRPRPPMTTSSSTAHPTSSSMGGAGGLYGPNPPSLPMAAGSSFLPEMFGASEGGQSTTCVPGRGGPPPTGPPMPTAASTVRSTVLVSDEELAAFLRET